MLPRLGGHPTSGLVMGLCPGRCLSVQIVGGVGRAAATTHRHDRHTHSLGFFAPGGHAAVIPRRTHRGGIEKTCRIWSRVGLGQKVAEHDGLHATSDMGGEENVL